MNNVPTPEEMARIILPTNADAVLVSKVTELIKLRDEMMRLRGEMAGAQKARESVADLLSKTAAVLGNPEFMVQLRDTVLAVDRQNSGGGS